MKLWRKSALIAPAVIIAMTAAACGGSDDNNSGGSSGGAAKGGQVIYGFETEFPENLFPYIAAGNSVATAYAEIRVLISPFKTHPDFTYQPDEDLVVGEPTSEVTGGKQVVTYKINPKASWSDGQPIDAKDFNFTWRLLKSSDPKAGGCPDNISTTGYDQISNVEGSDGDKTVTVTYAKPYSDWKSLFAPFLPAHIMDKTDAAANCAALKKGWPTADGIPVSSGPVSLEKAGIDPSKKILTLTRNPKWWGTPANLDRIILQGIGNDPGVSVNALRNNEVQVIYPQPQLDLVRNIKALEPTITSKTNFGLSFEHLDFNTKDALLAQLPVRQAIAYGLNRADIVAKTVGQFDNRAQVLNNRWLLNNQEGYQDTSGGLYDKQNVAKAQSLLEGAGFTKGSDGIYAKNGKRLSIQIQTTQGNPLRSNTIDVMTQQLKAVGIEVKKFLNADIFAGKEKPTSLEGGQYQAALFAWVGGPNLSQNTSIYQSPDKGIGQNYTRAGDPQVDKLMADLSTNPDTAAQLKLANEIDALLWKDLYTIPLYQKPTFLAYNSNYTGITENATNAGPLWEVEKWARKG